MDYKEIMNSSKEIKFSELYDNAINNIGKGLYLTDDLLDKLSVKRVFGLEKYGEYSFQSSLKNCLSTPTLEHALEEIVDLFNYLLHEHYKNNLLGNTEATKEIDKIIGDVVIVYEKINKLKNHI